MQKPVEHDHPLVSVIIPNYNHAQYVGDAIRSVLTQEYRNVEIIVVDDGSTDNSRDVVAMFGGQVQYYYQKNAGLSDARNNGINASKGSLIGVLDADDMYEPDFLSTMVLALQENPDADGIYCGYQFVDQENKLLPQIEARPVPSEELFPSLLEGNFLVPESVFVRRHCYEKAGYFDTSLQPCADWDMWLRITKQFKILFTTEILTRHRVLRGSMSTDPLKMLMDRLAVLKNHIGEEPVAGDDPTGAKRKAYGRAYLGSCIEYQQYGDPERAYQCFQKMANLCPSLLTEIDTFYQLGCGDQPKGSMGDLASLNVKRNSVPLLTMMTSLFVDPSTLNDVKRIQRAAHAKAYHTLGILAYNTREFSGARSFLSKAFLNDAKLMLNVKVLSMWVKTLLGPKLIDLLKSGRQRLAS